jgi:undecaprenyl-diphosphatase
MLWFEILLLAVIQGIAEFLPISSSGHVVVGAAIFDAVGHPIAEKLTVNIALHVGTLLAIVVFYWRRVWRLLGRDRRVIGLLIVGTLPAVGVGVLLKLSPLGPTIEAALESPLLAGLMFPLTALMLIWAARRPEGELDYATLGYRAALVIGLFQALAVLPGISRSGATIVAGLGCRLRRDEAAAFSFLLAIPAIAGGGVLEMVDLLRHGPGQTGLAVLLTGGLVSFAVGLVALWWLIGWLRRGRLQDFAWYLVPLGVLVVAWQVVSG